MSLVEPPPRPLSSAHPSPPRSYDNLIHLRSNAAYRMRKADTPPMTKTDKNREKQQQADKRQWARGERINGGPHSLSRRSSSGPRHFDPPGGPHPSLLAIWERAERNERASETSE
ncbi:hypothetical protein V8C44DRAFT_320570 [Trichoderma aethiopicum]